MSAICNQCREDIGDDTTIWYATTRCAPVTYFVCGFCLDLIPEEKRRPPEEDDGSCILFGRVDAEKSRKGIYQSCDARNRDAEYCVTPRDFDSIYRDDSGLTIALSEYYRSQGTAGAPSPES